MPRPLPSSCVEGGYSPKHPMAPTVVQGRCLNDDVELHVLEQYICGVHDVLFN